MTEIEKDLKNPYKKSIKRAVEIVGIEKTIDAVGIEKIIDAVVTIIIDSIGLEKFFEFLKQENGIEKLRDFLEKQ